MLSGKFLFVMDNGLTVCCVLHYYLACPILMGTQRRKLNWTEPPGENGLTMVFSTRPLKIPMWMQKGNGEEERVPWCFWSSLVEVLKADNRAGWTLYLYQIEENFRIDPEIKWQCVSWKRIDTHLNSLPCLCNRSGAGTSTVSSLGGEIINGAGALSIIYAIT